MCWRLLICLLILLPSSFCATPSGIPRELARERAQLISGVHYDLSFHLVQEGLTVRGEEAVRFSLKEQAPILLDYRDGSIVWSRINGHEPSIVHENGHLLLRKEYLRAGENEISIAFV